MLNEFLLALGDYILLGALPAIALFVGYYYFGSPWRKLLAGRSLMYFACALLGITLNVLFTLFLGPDYPGRELVRILIYGGVFITSWRLFFTLRHIQRANKVETHDALGFTQPAEEAGAPKKKESFWTRFLDLFTFWRNK